MVAAAINRLSGGARGSRQAHIAERAEVDHPDRRADLEHRAKQRLAEHCHFRGRARNFCIQQHDDVLVIRGRVPSFYLKQVLQTALKDLEGVRRIENQVDVVACDGLSSEPARPV